MITATVSGISYFALPIICKNHKVSHMGRKLWRKIRTARKNIKSLALKAATLAQSVVWEVWQEWKGTSWHHAGSRNIFHYSYHPQFVSFFVLQVRSACSTRDKLLLRGVLRWSFTGLQKRRGFQNTTTTCNSTGLLTQRWCMLRNMTTCLTGVALKYLPQALTRGQEEELKQHSLQGEGDKL